MKKAELLTAIDGALLERLTGYCYHRTRDSHEAQELCSDIVFALVRAANTDGEIGSLPAFIRRVAHNTYADFCARRRAENERMYPADPDEALQTLADEDDGSAQEEEQLARIYREIARLTRAYREVMILYYLDGLSAAQIAARQGITENAVRQRLFSARNAVRKGVNDMTKEERPLSLQKMEYVIWGTGNPYAGDPRTVASRQLSKQIVWLCRGKEMSARDIASALGVPTMYVEEELEIQSYGENGYGMLRRTESGRYTTNIILLDAPEFAAAHKLYTDAMPMVCDAAAAFLEAHRDEYMAFPYLNRRPEWNLVLWQHMPVLADALGDEVRDILAGKYFASVKPSGRPFTVFGYRRAEGDDTNWGAGWDGIEAQNVCGYRQVHLENLYTNFVRAHFHCGENIAKNPRIQLAIRAINGLAVNSLSENEQEHAARAVQEGYLYREGDTLYTRILVMTIEDRERLYAPDAALHAELHDAAEKIAAELAALIRRCVPAALLGDYRFVNQLAALPLWDMLTQALIQRGLLTAPENGVGAEGCWMCVQK